MPDKIIAIASVILALLALLVWLLTGMVHRKFMRQVAATHRQTGNMAKLVLRPPIPIVADNLPEDAMSTLRLHNNLVKLYWLLVIMTVIDMVLVFVLK